MLDIGIRVDGDFERLQLTIDSIARHAPGHRVVLLVPPELVDLPWSAFAPAEVVRTTRAGGATAFKPCSSGVGHRWRRCSRPARACPPARSTA